MKDTRFAVLLAILAAALSPTNLAANDSAASVAAGGIQLKRESRITMKSEKLFISRDKVRVEYEFLNETPQDITTEVAFPIPEYKLEFDAAEPFFNDFRLWIEGSELKYSVEVKALVNGADLAPLLAKYNIDAASFGHFDVGDNHSDEFAKLPPAAKDELVRAGLFQVDGEETVPVWHVLKTYHWTQIFPAGKILHVRHEYTPMAGFNFLHAEDLNDAARKAKIEEARRKLSAGKDPQSDKYELEGLTYLDDRLSSACIEPSLARAIAARINARKADPKAVQNYNVYVGATWVDYILTTANSWKTPIGDFELTVEKPASNNSSGAPVLTSFCWEGPVEKLDATHFVARAHDFVPKDELHVFFFDTF